MILETQIRRYRGDTYPIEVTLKKNGKHVDLTGATVEMHISYDPIKTLTATAVDKLHGQIKFDFEAADVDTVGSFTYDIQVTDSAGLITTYVKDLFVITNDIN